MSQGITIRHLAFTGPSVAKAELLFEDGLNIIYGASNTGKSFATKALAFMLGGSSKLPQTEQLTNYDAAWLGLSLPTGREVTLYRPTSGGNFRLYEGLVMSPGTETGSILRSVSDTKRADTVSHFLLELFGWNGKVLVSNSNYDKENLTIRHIVPYAIVSEEDIISEHNPVHHSRQHSNRTMESNLLRFLLTGLDDAAAVTVISKKTRVVATRAKVELVDEMIAQLDAELGDEAVNRAELEEQMGRLTASLTYLHDDLRNAQGLLDTLVSERRSLMDTAQDVAARVVELEVTLQRFGTLSEVYKSDIGRLEALEESGYVLVARAGRDCPVCGAPASAQQHNHASEEIERSYQAAAAEARKIQLEQRDLHQTMRSLEAEAQGLRGRSERVRTEILDVEKRIEGARPKESSARTAYESLSSKKAELERTIELLDRRDRLVVRRSQIEKPPAKNRQSKLPVGVEGPIAFRLGETVAEVLQAWKFPQAASVQFDTQTSDITIAGKVRAANGKGVRAVLHAAFNVALLIFCRDQNLPHPGFLVLDTPLLTYREPLTSKHGELSEDEATLKNSPLAMHFYEHLASLKELAQIIVVENSDPPAEILHLAHIATFTGQRGAGRYGLFPA
ncbi:hypothetical protein IVB51_05690 [Bradyrhizobium sp. CW10]|nr:hypothetical protein [Bradyrhizobium sp. CW10]